MQPLDEIERHYANPDPWGYQASPADAERKATILDALNMFGPYQRGLDIGCGEGWITKDIPADEIHGFECSNNAAERFPPNVKRVLKPEGKYDLVMATGIMYQHYNWEKFLYLINYHSSLDILTCNIKAWEIPMLQSKIKARQVVDMEFDYCPGNERFTQKLRIFQV